MFYKKHYTKTGVELIAFQKEWLAKKRESRGQPDWLPRTGVSSFTVKENGRNVVYTDMACSAHFKYKVPSHLIYWCNRAYNEVADVLGKQAVDMYYTWLFNESPWSDAFITKKPLYARRYGIEMDTSAHGGLVYGATIALRVWEYEQRITGWYELVKLGVNPNLAYITAHYCYARDSEFILRNNPLGAGHIAIDAKEITSDFGLFHRFILGRPEVPTTKNHRFYCEGVAIELYRANAVFLTHPSGKRFMFQPRLIKWAKEAAQELRSGTLNPFAKKAQQLSLSSEYLAKKLKDLEETLRDVG